MKKWLKSTVIGLFVVGSTPAITAPSVLKVYLDSDRTVHLASAEAIEMGVKTAFSQHGNQLFGIPVEFEVLDHRGNTARSKLNMQRYQKDPNGIVFFAGLHSSPLIKYRDYINESELLILVPWAAGGPITRYPSEKNFVFRLSVDDTKVGGKLVSTAINNGCQSVDLLLEKTPWGKSNYKTIFQSVADHSTHLKARVTWFNWGIDETLARVIAAELNRTGVECVLFVGNSREGPLLVKALSDLEQPPKIFSHWGITGGGFSQRFSFDARQRTALSFVQSCFNFYSSPENDLSKEVYRQATALFPDKFTNDFIDAPAGFVHGYDLAKVFIQAAQSITLTDDMVNNRQLLKLALEQMDTPVQGLLKTYEQPFSVYDVAHPDAHEALGADDLCMARYTQVGAIKLLDSAKINKAD
uniref:Branched-chain amino acid ABC transporter, aminoacid-binding protein n=1 Tax=Vibrio tasmaniensis TaxID=212663 RepID=A0A0H3ZRS5_9VIBR|nr:Branched-chain amino acid ABC transporter, aminoacid-binding protein [Vibrio tasmaniensis]